LAIQLSPAVRNARLDAIETTISTAPTLEIRTGAAPADCAAADTGSVLATLTLPSDWMAAASGGSKAKAGTWTGTASGTGTAGHFRIKQGATCHLQGSVGMGSGDMSLVNTSIATTQPVTIDTFTLSDPNG
jgi:hypothetical protein